MTFSETVLDTPAGRLHVWATSGEHVGIRTEGYAITGERQRRSYDSPIDADTWDTIAPFVTFRGVDYLVRVDLKNSGDGWRVDGNPYVSRVTGNAPSTATADRLLQAQVIEPLIAWLATAEGREFVTTANGHAARAKLDAARTALEVASQALAAAEEAYKAALIDAASV